MYAWLVIGAGPAGIAAVGQLMSLGVNPSEIAWVDPRFAVGDLGEYWQAVSSNTRVKLFLKFLYTCPAFQFAKVAQQFALSQYPPEQTCLLKDIVEPLQWITEQLKLHVQADCDVLTELNYHDGHWQARGKAKLYHAHKVILALGAEPKQLAITDKPVIALTDALDKNKLASKVQAEDIIAVFGSSHSAVNVLQALHELQVQKIINFYQAPLKYAVYYEDWILHDNTGLKGNAAQWAKQYLHEKPPANLLRVQATADNIQHYLPQCTKVVFAVGFVPRTLTVNGSQQLVYDAKTGVIAPGLFGCGIAFPEQVVDRNGNSEWNVGLWKFMDFLLRMLPLWIKAG